MIPKIIHYCWFGRNPLPKSAQKCIASWRKYLPEYEIKEWNEDNFDVNMIQYTKDAYAAKKYAFVSDYARFWILYHYGGVYFDTDVEVIRPMDDIIEKGAFMGLESYSHDGEGMIAVNPGLGMASGKDNIVYSVFLDEYRGMSFYDANKGINRYTMIPMVSRYFVDSGLEGINDRIEAISGINIYPTDYFNPYDSKTGDLSITRNTRTIHWYSASWLSWTERKLLLIKRRVRSLLSKAL
jgi:mannosyltransferase OCH1-like enzyme